MKRQYKEADHIPGMVLYYCNPEKILDVQRACVCIISMQLIHVAN